MEIISTAQELEKILGDNVKSLRLQKNISRQMLCQQAGVSENALRHLEGGQGATVKTLMCILKALGRSDWLQSLAPQVSINPLHLVRDKSIRQRASRQNGKKQKR